jgi:predicted secreted protein
MLRIWTTTCAALLLLLTAACAGGPADEQPTPTAPAPADGTASPTDGGAMDLPSTGAPDSDPAGAGGGADGAGTAPPPVGILTEADDGTRVQLAVGEERPLQLTGLWTWDEPAVAGAGVALSPVDYLMDPGYREWMVTAVAAGTATITATGEPACGDESVCPPRTVRIEVDVRG